MLSDKQIQDAVFAVLRKWKDDRAWDRYTRETGPYDATELRAEVLEIIKAVLVVADGVTVPGAQTVSPADADAPVSERDAALALCVRVIHDLMKDWTEEFLSGEYASDIAEENELRARALEAISMAKKALSGAGAPGKENDRG